MYQFYYADRSQTWEQKKCTQSMADRFHVTAVRPAMWEEHCLECSAPYCFDTCLHYSARSDGRCKRFRNGLLTFPEESACCGQGVHVTFRKWGNMMTVLFPAMLSPEKYRAMWKHNEHLGKFLGAVEGSRLPQALRWQGIRVPEFIRRKHLRGLKGLDNRADAFLFQGFSYLDKPYHLILEIYQGDASVYKASILVNPGENLEILTNLPESCSEPGNLVKIYPENNLEAELDILWCDFVQGERIAAEAPAQKVKCVVWDLDGTLWDGVLIETENPASLRLRPGVRDVMEALDARGILQSVASKNDREAAMSVLERLGISKYFLYPQIHWDAKSGSLQQIARSLNIGIDTFAFVDDTPFERGEVASALPQVRVYDASEIGSLLKKAEFDVPVTRESRERRAMYQAEEKRSSMQESAHLSALDFLRSCHLQLELFCPETHDEVLRCYELAVRTNQLNMSGAKYTPQEFQQVLERPDHENLAFSCRDNYGEYGIVGFCQYKLQGEALVFTEFAMSCRVAGKFAESALFSALLKKENCRTGLLPVKKSKKNGLLRNNLVNIGCKLQNDTTESCEFLMDQALLNREIVSVKER